MTRQKTSRLLGGAVVVALSLGAIGSTAAHASFSPREDTQPGFIALDSTETRPSVGYFASGDHLLTASGVYYSTLGLLFDAACSQRVNSAGATTWAPTPGRVSFSNASPYTDLVWTPKNPNTSGCDPAHVYTTTVTVADNAFHYGSAVFLLNNPQWKWSTGWLVLTVE